MRKMGYKFETMEIETEGTDEKNILCKHCNEPLVLVCGRLTCNKCKIHYTVSIKDVRSVEARNSAMTTSNFTLVTDKIWVDEAQHTRGKNIEPKCLEDIRNNKEFHRDQEYCEGCNYEDDCYVCTVPLLLRNYNIINLKNGKLKRELRRYCGDKKMEVGQTIETEEFTYIIKEKQKIIKEEPELCTECKQPINPNRENVGRCIRIDSGHLSWMRDDDYWYIIRVLQGSSMILTGYICELCHTKCTIEELRRYIKQLEDKLEED